MIVSEPLYKAIPGWFDFEAVYDMFVQKAPLVAKFAEIGCFCGKSACYLAHRIKQSGKPLEIVAVDVWPKDIYGQNPDCFIRDTLVVFTGNVDQGGFDKIITQVVRGDSAEAAKLFTDKSFFAAMIDANHSYEAVLADIRAWLPKIQPGGFLAGHDFGHGHPGVEKAVREVFGDGFTVTGQTWIVRVKA